MREIVDSIWFQSSATLNGTIGIVKVKTVDGYRYYIGNGTGYNQESDEKVIADFGAPIYLEQIKNFFS